MERRLTRLGRALFNRVVMQPAVQRMLLPFGHDLQPQRWVFILGCYNSGTTLLANILRQHPQMAGLPNEGGFLTDALPYPERYGWPRMWSQCLDRVHLAPGPGGAERALRIKRHWSLWYPRDAENLIEKSIANAARMPFLEAYFQPAHFIYIVRNGYAVARGIQRKANLKRWHSPYAETGYPIGLCARQWRVTDEVVERDRKHVRRFLSLRYEDLTERADETLRQITDFLALEPLPEEVIHRRWNVHEASEEPIRNMNAASLAALSPKDYEQIESVAAPTLARYGYLRAERAEPEHRDAHRVEAL